MKLYYALFTSRIEKSESEIGMIDSVYFVKMEQESESLYWVHNYLGIEIDRLIPHRLGWESVSHHRSFTFCPHKHSNMPKILLF